MPTANQNQINRLSREIADLQTADARAAKTESEILAKINRANDAAGRTKSASMFQSRLREVEKFTKDLAAIRSKRAAVAKKIATASKSLSACQDRQSKDDTKARKAAADEQRRLIREREEHERRVTQELRNRAALAVRVSPDRPVDEHDFFVSHASEDKDGLVRDLAMALRQRGARVWYDEFTLRVGDSLRRNIDLGLRNSRFGIVVLSEHFFRKEWPNRELDGLVALEVQGEARILPIWHKVSKDEVARYSPTLADKVALNTSLKSVEQIADELMSLIAPDAG